MAAITAELNLEISRFRASINRANRAMSNFAKKGERHGRTQGKGFAKGFNTEVTGMFKRLAAVVGISAAGIVLGKQFVAAMKDAAERERFEVGVSALTGDAEIGNEFFAHLRAEAKRTGADIADLALTTRRMIGMGLSPDEAKKLTASILDIQGSLALTNDEAKRLTVGLLQVKSKGIASMEELRQQIAEKGVPIFDALARSMDFDTPDDLFKAIEQGLIPAEAVLDIFTNLTGEFAKFRGGADKMAQTLGGAFNVMTAHFKDLRISFSAPIADTIRPILRDITAMLDGLSAESLGFGEKVAQGIGLLHTAMQELSGGEMMSLLGDGLKVALLGAMVAVHDGFTALFGGMLDDGFWESFERKFQVIAIGFGATLLDGMQKALGFQPPQEFWELTPEQKRNAQPGTVIAGFRDINRFKEERLRESGQTDLADSTARAKALLEAFGDPHGALKAAKAQLAENIAPLEAQRLFKLQQERDKQRELRTNPDKPPGAHLPANPFSADKDNDNGRFPIRLFPGLMKLVKQQSRTGIEGSDFGTDFKGTSTIGGATAASFAKKTSVSLQDAVDFLFGETGFEEQKKGNDLQAKVVAAMERIEAKDPVKVIKKLDPAFSG